MHTYYKGVPLAYDWQWNFKSLYYPWTRWCNNTNLILQKMDTKLSVLLSVEVFIQFKLILTEVISVYWIARNTESKTDLTRERKKIKKKKKDYLKKMFCGEEEALNLVNCEVSAYYTHVSHMYMHKYWHHCVSGHQYILNTQNTQ